MAPEARAGEGRANIDRALQAWRQGDCTLEPQWFIHRLDPGCPLTPAGLVVSHQGTDVAKQQVIGLAVVSQTCDIVRACQERPYLELCPLVQVDPEALGQIQRARRPAYAFLPQLASRHLVVDLDRTMTAEKAVVLHWTRVAGCVNDADARAFAEALARKRARFAFPDDFILWIRRLRGRVVDKHNRDSPEGQALRGLREIRVQALPSWENDAVKVIFFFIPGDDQDEDVPLQFLDACLNLVPASGRFTPDGQVAGLGDLTAAEYVNSDPLDFGYVSLADPASEA